MPIGSLCDQFQLSTHFSFPLLWLISIISTVAWLLPHLAVSHSLNTEHHIFNYRDSDLTAQLRTANIVAISRHFPLQTNEYKPQINFYKYNGARGYG
jgi:hypothetical protein